MILERTDATFTLMNAYPYTSGTCWSRRCGTSRRSSTSTLRGGGADGRGPAGQRRACSPPTGPAALNVGANIGRAAGAGVPGHVHLHALPRWAGDTNFMTAVAETRVLPESLRASYDQLRAAWRSVGSAA